MAGWEGSPRWLGARIYPGRNPKGGVIEVTLMLEEVTARKELEDRLVH